MTKVGAYWEKEERELEKMAWGLSLILNCWTSKKITPDKLLGRNRKVSAKWVRKERETLKREFGLD